MARRSRDGAPSGTSIRANDTALSALPPWARTEMEATRDRIEAVRSRLEHESPQKWMPPIELVPRAWVRGPDTVDGAALFFTRGTRSYPGVEFPAQVAAYPIDELTGLIIHEASHVFMTIEMALGALHRGDGRLQLPEAHDDDSDDAHHINVPDWFGPSVVHIPKRGDLSLLHHYSGPWLNRWAESALPIDEREQVPFKTAEIVFAPSVVARWHELRGK